MEDLSLHILDIAENSIAAHADRIKIHINEDTQNDKLSLFISDNGTGMDRKTKKKVLDPFFTSKTVRNVQFGLGLPLLFESARAANGGLSIKSRKGKGTQVRVWFQLSHIDRKPIGDMRQTLITLILGNPDVDFEYVHNKDGRSYRLDTAEWRARLGDIPLHTPEIMNLLKEDLKNIP
jgi:signal transduction histidine kinase